MNRRQLLLEMARQLYEDCQTIAENNSTQPLDEDGCSMFNTLLQEMQAEFPECDLLLKFREIPARSVKFKDAMLITGQLQRIAAHLLDDLPTELETIDTPSPSSAAESSASGESVSGKRAQPATQPQGAKWPVPPKSSKPTGRTITSHNITPPLGPTAEVERA